jgi:hypothetical protein
MSTLLRCCGSILMGGDVDVGGWLMVVMVMMGGEVRWLHASLASQPIKSCFPRPLTKKTLLHHHTASRSREDELDLFFICLKGVKKHETNRIDGRKCDDTGGAMTIPRDDVSTGGHAARLGIGNVWSLRLRARTVESVTFGITTRELVIRVLNPSGWSSYSHTYIDSAAAHDTA